MCRASVAAGADGVHVEVHNCPEKALSDGPQALLPHQFLDLMGDLRRLASALGREFSAPRELNPGEPEREHRDSPVARAHASRLPCI